MSILFFLIILLVLVISHEFGHFIVAKLSGIKVEEFGFGFPPRAVGKKVGETIYSLNWLPFGGFVKLLGEEPDVEVSKEDEKRSFGKKPIIIRLAVVVAGVVFNLLLAWILVSAGFMSGLPMPVGAAPTGAIIGDSRLVITDVQKGSPAEVSHLGAGVMIKSLVDTTTNERMGELTPDAMIAFITPRAGHELEMVVLKDGLEEKVLVTPKSGLVSDRAVIGVGLDQIAAVRLPFFGALKESAVLTYSLTKTTVVALAHLVGQVFQGGVSSASVTGPIGIIGLVETARSFGWIYLLGLTAIISINLAVINLLPIPALDGGHVLFLVIEWLRRGKPVSAKVRARASGICFMVLIALMVLVTISDIWKLFK